MKWKIFFIITLVILIAGSSLPAYGEGAINLLHSFAGYPTEGASPYYSNLIQDSTILYGLTELGGSTDCGTVFKINTDGNDFTLLHSFAGGASDGAYPTGSLILSGSTLYGMTTYGGSSSNYGTIFKINTDGGGFTLLHSFAGGASDGAYPKGSLILSGSTLYGMTTYGGSNSKGVIFKIDTEGTGFTLLRSFAGGENDGAKPEGSLTLSGSTLYGLTAEGGNLNYGVIFKINTDNSSFTILHPFTGEPSDGANPYGSLTLSGLTLYGLTASGGSSSNYGTIFKINTDGTGYTILRSFTGALSDGANPYGSLTLSGSTLYGLTLTGGNDDYGVIFKINTTGTSYTLLHSFTGGSDGGYPFGSLAGTSLYGMTNWGGDSNFGTIFSLVGETRIELLSFQAELVCSQADIADQPKVTLSWKTASEIDNAGFYLNRALTKDGPYCRITPGFIPATGSSMIGASYSYDDHDLITLGQTYYYQLEDIDNAGYSTFHGPVSVVAYETTKATTETSPQDDSSLLSSDLPAKTKLTESSSGDPDDSSASDSETKAGHGCFIVIIQSYLSTNEVKGEKFKVKR